MRIALLLTLVACATDAQSEPTRPMAPAQKPPEANRVEPKLAAMIRAAAKPYHAWGRVDEHPNVAPMMCDMPRPRDYGSQGRVHMSESADAPHGKKLYYLWASDRDTYERVGVEGTVVKPGFTIVKESYAAVPTGSAHTELTTFDAKPPLHDKLQVGDKWLTTGPAKGLYVMTKTGDADSDAGWIYGTIAPTGEVTSAGKVASCMGCHEDAPHDRLFGPKLGEKHGY